MLKRIGTAVVLLLVVFGALLGLRQFNLIFADLIGILVCCLGAYEMHHAFKLADYKPMAVPTIITALAIYPLTYFLQEKGILIALLLAVVLAVSILTFDHKYSLKDMLATLFINLYPIILFSPFFIINNSKYGLLAIMLLLFVPIMTDTMAYFVGVTCKGPKLCPNISPKKTISGAVGGILGGIIGAMLVFTLFDAFDVFKSFKNVGTSYLTPSVAISATIYAVVGIVGGVICEIGDLGASWIKRQAGIKDFGKIFPGHGGMMDRLDSILFMMPIVYVLVTTLEMVYK